MTITKKQREDNVLINKKQMELWNKEIENRDQQNAIIDRAEKRKTKKSCFAPTIVILILIVIVWLNYTTS